MKRTLALGVALLGTALAHTPTVGQITQCSTVSYTITRIVHHPDGSFTRTAETHFIIRCT